LLKILGVVWKSPGPPKHRVDAAVKDGKQRRSTAKGYKKTEKTNDDSNNRQASDFIPTSMIFRPVNLHP
jgi:hypothetical protein